MRRQGSFVVRFERLEFGMDPIVLFKKYDLVNFFLVDQTDSRLIISHFELKIYYFAVYSRVYIDIILLTIQLLVLIYLLFVIESNSVIR